MRVCIMTQSKSQVIIVDEIVFNNDKELPGAELFINKMLIGNYDLTKCELRKLDRTDGNMEYYEVVEKTAQEVPVQEQQNKIAIPLNNSEWIGELAEKVATCLTTRGILSKE